VYDNVKADLHLASVSGGSDVCTAFVLGVPTLPVHAGEIQTRGLGCAVTTYDSDGREVHGEVGELVITRPMPSMPVFLWGDDDGSRLRETYFSDFPGVWRHGDWARVTERDSFVIYGRSDSTLNRGGVRIGTAEFYRVVEELPEIVDSLVVDTSELGADGQLLLYVVLRDGEPLDPALVERIRSALRTQVSPRHVPDVIEAVPEVPRTLNGKKLEVPVKRLLAGVPLERAVSVAAVANPAALDRFVRTS
jgi:acetoacetyl-CoA synthetase